MLILLLFFALPAFVSPCKDTSHCHSHAEESALTTSQVVADMKETVEKSKSFLHTMGSALHDYVIDVETRMLVNAQQLENSLLLSSKDAEQCDCKASIDAAFASVGIVHRQVPQQCELSRASRDTAEKEGFAALPSQGGRFRSVAYGTYLISNRSNQERASMTPGPIKPWENWVIEQSWYGDVRVYLRVVYGSRYLRGGSPDGRVYTSWKWETWKPFRNADGTWSLQSLQDQWLSADKNGVVTTVAKLGKEERFAFEPLADGVRMLIAEYGRQITLRSAHHRYVRANGPEMNSTADLAPEGPPTASEQWIIENSGGLAILKPAQRPTAFLSINVNGTVYLAEEEADKQPEKWLVQKNIDGSWSFQNVRLGVWICAMRDGLMQTMPNRSAWESFWIEEWN